MLSIMILLGVASGNAPATPPSQPTQSEPAAPDDPDGAGITWNDATDPKIVLARERARSELPDFFRHLDNPAADERMFHVKLDLAGTSEFIWANNLLREGRQLTGELANTPLHREYRMGQRVEIPNSAIVDWGYFRGAIMQSNYTTGVQLETMNPQEARDVRRDFGW